MAKLQKKNSIDSESHLATWNKMKTKYKISITSVIIGLVMTFGSYVSQCEPNSMIQTLETRLCETFNVVLLFTTNIFSYIMILVGLVVFSYDLIIKPKKQNLRNNQ